MSGLERFMEYFRTNYPGPNTIIAKPDWHSPKIYRAAIAASVYGGRDNAVSAEILSAEFPDAKERRRYELLKAAATIHAMSLDEPAPVAGYAKAVQAAIGILTEIEEWEEWGSR